MVSFGGVWLQDVKNNIMHASNKENNFFMHISPLFLRFLFIVPYFREEVKWIFGGERFNLSD